MKTTIEISAEEFERKYKDMIPLKNSKENKFYGKAKDGNFTFRSSERTDTLIKGTYTDVEGHCELEYNFTKPVFDKVFWTVYIAITAFFALALISKHALFSLLSALIMLFGIICMLIQPKKFQKNLETSFMAFFTEPTATEEEPTADPEAEEETSEKSEKEEESDNNVERVDEE